MNIFALDKNPYTAARYLCDKHVVKMLLESVQILVSGLRQHDCPIDKLPKNKMGNPYGKGYPHHPSTRWAMQTDLNFDWLTMHAIGISEQYTLRYKKVHACYWPLHHIIHEHLCRYIPQGPLTDFALAMPDKYKSPDPIQSYRDYYIHEKADIAVWKYTKTPEWFSN